MATQSPQALAKQLLGVLKHDRDCHLLRIDDYMHGEHDDPYMPAMADDEYRLLARRSVTNLMPILVTTPTQCLYVDGFRSAARRPETVTDELATPAWDHWQLSRLDARQIAVHSAALTYGHSFTVTEKDARSGKVKTKGLSALKTAALFEDPANDDTPVVALTVLTMPSKRDDSEAIDRGTARMWDARFEYAVTFDALGSAAKVTVTKVRRHGASECPVTRFAASVDLEGRTVGVVEPMIVMQDRINQTVFDLLVAQTYDSFQVRTVTGMAPPMQTEPVYELDGGGNPVTDDQGRKIVIGARPVYDENGKPIPAAINHNARRFLFAENKDARFGSLEGTALEGFIASLEMCFRHWSAMSQTPPHYLLGQIANLSAEALDAAEVGLLRMVSEFRSVFGECWERVFRLAAELNGDTAGAEDFHGEVIWRDMEQRNLAQAADALGKLADQLGIPKIGLWKRVPGVTENELSEWEDLAKQEDTAGTLAEAIRRAVGDVNTAGQPTDEFAVPQPIHGNPVQSAR